MAQTFALIAPGWPILHQVSWNRETVQNAPERKETHQNMSLGNNGVDRERSLQKFKQDIMARTFALIAPVWRVLQQVSCSSKTDLNVPKWKEMHENMSLGSNYVDRERLFWEILMRLYGTNFCFNCTRLAHLHRVLCSSETVPNAPKQKETHQKMSLGKNGVDLERSLRKIHARNCGMKFCINCTSLARFAPSFVQ